MKRLLTAVRDKLRASTAVIPGFVHAAEDIICPIARGFIPPESQFPIIALYLASKSPIDYDPSEQIDEYTTIDVVLYHQVLKSDAGDESVIGDANTTGVLEMADILEDLLHEEGICLDGFYIPQGNEQIVTARPTAVVGPTEVRPVNQKTQGDETGGEEFVTVQLTISVIYNRQREL